jgi:ribosomal protein S18 acetylase RimI-like enzyme
MEQMVLREAHPEDAAAVARLHVESWRDAYASILNPEFLAGPIENDRLAFWTARLKQPPPEQIVRVAEQQIGRIIGFICAHRDYDKTWGNWIDNLHVLPSMRGRRIGEQLLSSMAELLARQRAVTGLHLWVFQENVAALRFYERMGGKIVGRDHSRIPAASGKVVLQIYWPSAEAVGRTRSTL